jgi:hypothetical protein
MVKVTAVLRATGTDFSPEAVEHLTGISFSKKHERGSSGTIGRYRGQPLPYGSAELASPETGMDLMVPDAPFFAAIEKLAPACSTAGATSTVLHIDVAFTDQCNIELSPEFISALARLGIPITMSCFQEI